VSRMEPVFKYRVIKLTVRIPGETVFISENMLLADGGLIYLTGIAVVTVEEAYTGSAFRKFYLNSEELFPNDFEIRLLALSYNISYLERFYSMDIHCKTKLNFEIAYKDAESDASYPHNVHIYFRFEVQKRNKEQVHFLGEKI
jgi:hypothetical protein